MTPEEKELLTQSVKLSEENNKILRGLRRRARFSSFIHIVYWIIILGSIWGTYYFLQPYIDAMVKGYSGMQGDIENAKNVVNKLLDSGLLR